MEKGLLVVCTILLLCCCSDDDDQNNNFQSITLTETVTSDTYPVYRTETYSLVNDRVTSRDVLQKYLESETSFGTQLTYEGNTVTRTDINGNQAIYTLNANGYATNCHYEESDVQHDYTFSYSSDNYLERIDESVNGQPHSTLTITYKEGDIVCVTINDAPIVYEPGTEDNKYAFPCLPLLESPLMEYHKEAYFSGLLGKSTLHFVVRTAYQGNEDEWTQYTYSFSSEGKPTNIDTKTIYKGSIFDSAGMEHITTSSLYRHIAINMK